jgi:hypothetical protein
MDPHTLRQVFEDTKRIMRYRRDPKLGAPNDDDAAKKRAATESDSRGGTLYRRGAARLLKSSA